MTAIRIINYQAYRKFREYLLAPYLRLHQNKHRNCKSTASQLNEEVNYDSCAMGLGGCYPLSDHPPSSCKGKDTGAVMLLSRCILWFGEVLQISLRDLRLRVIELVVASTQVNDIRISGVALRKLAENSCEISPLEVPSAELFVLRLINICAVGIDLSGTSQKSTDNGSYAAPLLARGLLERISHSASWRRHLSAALKKASNENSPHRKTILALQPLIGCVLES